MLSALQLEQQRPRRPLPSLKQLYHEYILQRIEDYKNGLRRNQLLNLANEAFAEMGTTQEAQFVLTEVLMGLSWWWTIHTGQGSWARPAGEPPSISEW